MGFKKGRNKISADFNMSSMTDIVFLLLIFFMLTSTLVTVNAIDVLLPKANGKTENKAVIAVSITSEGDYYIGTDKVDVANLEDKILEAVSRQDTPSIVLRGDGEGQLKNTVKVLDIAQRNKIKMVLATQPY